MMKFPIKQTGQGYFLYNKSDERLIEFGNFILYKEDKRSASHCLNNLNRFDYQRTINALCGRSRYNKNDLCLI